MKEKLEQILAELKLKGVSVAKLESDLKFSNGLLGKVKNGKSNLSDEKFDMVQAYYDKLINNAKSVTENEPKSEAELMKFASSVSINSAFKQIQEEESTPRPEPKPLPKAKGIMMGADYLAELPKTVFQKLLIEFNGLVEELPPISKIEANLMALIEKSQHPELTARQSEAIRARCINYLTGQYAGQKQKI